MDAILVRTMAIEPKSADTYSGCDERPSLSMAMLAVLVGVIAGLGAVGFRCLIAFIHNLSFSGVFSFYYNAKWIRIKLYR
jgi:hypothetical protein